MQQATQLDAALTYVRARKVCISFVLCHFKYVSSGQAFGYQIVFLGICTIFYLMNSAFLLSAVFFGAVCSGAAVCLFAIQHE